MAQSAKQVSEFARHIDDWLNWLSSIKHYQSHTIDAYSRDLAGSWNYAFGDLLL